MPTVRPAAVIDELSATVDFLRISVGGPSDGWLRCAPLVGEPDALGALISSTKVERGTERDDVATSLFVQGYAFRIASTAIGVWVLGDVVLDVAPGTTSIAVERGRPNAVRLDAATAKESASVADLHAELVDGHLAPLVATARRTCRIGAALLWGNVAASCVAAFGAVAGALAARRVEVRDRAEACLAGARPEVRDAGRLVRVGEQFAWERRSCCLWYQTASAWLCEDCSLRSAEDRQERYASMLAEQVAP